LNLGDGCLHYGREATSPQPTGMFQMKQYRKGDVNAKSPVDLQV